MKPQTILHKHCPKQFEGHAVEDKIVVPGAYYLLQVFDQVNDKSQLFKQVEFHLPLFLTDLDKGGEFRLTTDPHTKQQQVKYEEQVVATFSQEMAKSPERSIDVWRLPRAEQTAKEAYQNLWHCGNQFSGQYQLLDNMCQSDRLSQFSLSGSGCERVHIIDACLHSILLGAADSENSARVLMRIEECELRGELDCNLTIQVAYKQRSDDVIEGDVNVLDANGQVTFAAKGVQFCTLSQSAQRTALVQANFTLAQLEEVSEYLSARLNMPYQIETESYVDWRHALARPEATPAAFDSRFLVVRAEDLIKPQLLQNATELDTSYLPNGMQVAQINKYETDYLYREIFVDRCYGRHGITINEHDVVIDIGANIGMFSLYALQQAADVKVFAFEPSPQVAQCLRANVEGRGDVEVICAGVAQESGEAIFSFYPRTSVFSSFYSAAEDDLKTLREIIGNQVRKMTQSEAPDLLEELTESMIQDRLQKEEICCPLMNLSNFIQQKSIEEIGLLKIDAEKAELGILRSLSAQDFKRIRQICLEVHDEVGDKLQEALEILGENGFIVQCEEEAALFNTGLYTVTAQRKISETTQGLNYSCYGIELELPELKQAIHDYASKTQQPLHLVVAPSADPCLQTITTCLHTELSSWIAHLPTINKLSTDTNVDLHASLFSETLPDEADIPYSALWYGLLGREVFNQLICKDKTPLKLIIVDADNTLWSGVVAEQGVDGIELSQTHLQLQQFLLEQHEKGVLLAVCSKNIENDVLNVFTKRQDMLLKPEHFVAIKANWQAKSSNVFELTNKLSISLDSVAFIDDNPVELAEVTGTFPQVLVLQFNDDEKQLATMMNHWAFTTGTVTAEDMQRSKLYLENQKRDEQLLQSQSYEEFLANLELELDFSSLQQQHIARVAQLTERTNQFNATKLIFDRQTLSQQMDDPTKQCFTLQVKDKYGDYGLVGAAFISLQDDCAYLDNILLSCRALGKGIEERFISAIAQWVLNTGVSEVVLQWRDLPRNLSLKNLYGRVVEDAATKGKLYQSKVPASALCNLKFVLPRSEPVTAASETKSSGLSLQFVNHCYIAVAEIESLVEQVWPEHDAASIYLPEADVLELKLARIWFKVLGHPIESLDHDFFSLGGNSLRLVRVLSLIYQEFDIKLSLFEAFERKRTIRQQAAFIRAKNAIKKTVEQPATPRRDAPPLRLSENQLGIYFSQILNPSTSAYNVPLCLELDKSTSIENITKAARQVGETHPILRTGYCQRGRVTEAVELDNWLAIQTVQLHTAHQSDLVQQVKRLAEQPIDLGGPVVRLNIIETADSYVLLFVLHHLNCDFTSMELFFDCFLKALHSPVQPKNAELFPNVVEDVSEQAQRFWTRQLSQINSLNLPVTANGAHQKLHGGGLTQVLSADQSTKIDQLIQASGVSSFVYLLGCYCRYLRQLTETSDFAVGIPVCLREAEQADQIGNFVNLLPIRVSDEITQANWAKVLSRKLLELLEFKAYPYRRMVQDARLQTDTGRAPLTQTTFAFHEPVYFPEATTWFGEKCSETTTLNGQQIRLHGHIQQKGQTDIAVEMFCSSKQYCVNVKYDTQLLSPSYASAFLNGFIEFIFDNFAGE